MSGVRATRQTRLDWVLNTIETSSGYSVENWECLFLKTGFIAELRIRDIAESVNEYE